MKVWLFALTGPPAAQWPAEKEESARAREWRPKASFPLPLVQQMIAKGKGAKSFKSFLFFSFFEILEKEKFGAQFYTLDFRL